jgi:hypothetical protein
LAAYRFWNSGEPRINAAPCAAVVAFDTVPSVDSETSPARAVAMSEVRGSSAEGARSEAEPIQHMHDRPGIRGGGRNPFSLRRGGL